MQQVCDDPIEVAQDLYQIGNDQFALALPHNREFVEHLSDAPFITIIYWAPDVEAAKKCAFRQPNHYENIDSLPPPELLDGTNGMYKQICERAGALAANTAVERAVYSGKTGAFVHKFVAVGPLKFCFLKREIQAEEMPYAIEISLK